MLERRAPAANKGGVKTGIFQAGVASIEAMFV
jgi:hypothetical protein